MEEFEERQRRKKEKKESKKEKSTGEWVGEESKDTGGASGSGSKGKEAVQEERRMDQHRENVAKRLRFNQEREYTDEDKAFQEDIFGPA
eukprot:8820410-Karenia_brevis.AAC.1